jgi:hypothetical protein
VQAHERVTFVQVFAPYAKNIAGLRLSFRPVWLFWESNKQGCSRGVGELRKISRNPYLSRISGVRFRAPLAALSNNPRF